MFVTVAILVGSIVSMTIPDVYATQTGNLSSSNANTNDCPGNGSPVDDADEPGDNDVNDEEEDTDTGNEEDEED